MTVHQHLTRVGAVAAVSGALTLFIATLLHPMNADPNDPAVAFAEYAADQIWVASHLGQFVGVAVLGVALVALAGTMERSEERRVGKECKSRWLRCHLRRKIIVERESTDGTQSQ